ncbi:MAG TPA: serine/threonine-protein kinase [Actinocrinis sp.]|uniref:serine/threonine-protein kinase n=1 Tax=Actinocrinis sp. TaxID=1920516 RepID=UPI002D6C28EF|nr:serine/threonine-protein kinase [Actinocrinis sp.]HZU57689.1 serine/threonine-protein kinase [Actinocrinis sp.]
MEPAIPGTLLAGRYLLVRPLGSGGSATVWEAVDTSYDRPVAVKLLRGAAVNDPTERERLRREARVLARLAHPRICAIRDYLESPRPDGSTVPVLVTELLTGTSLARRLKEGPLPWAEAVRVCAQIADALLAAHHAGVVHRDVKPANVMLVADGAKLLDFGIARGAGDGDLTGNLTVGTPLCMAPEQVRGQRAKPASDIYALGCVLFWSLTGRPPYQSNDITEIFESQLYDPPPSIEVPGLPARVIEFCHSCLSKNPAFRPNAAQALTTLSGLAAAAGVPLGDEFIGRRSISAFEAVPQPQSVQDPRVGAQYQAAPVPPPPPAPVQAPGESTMLSETFDDEEDLGDVGAAFDGRLRPRGAPEAGRRRDRGNQDGRRGPRPMLLGMAALVVLVAIGVVALVLTTSHAATGTFSAGPRETAQLPNPSRPTGGPTAPMPRMGGGAAPSITASAADPIRYLEAVRAQIRVFVADGPATLDPTTGGDLQNSIIDIENSVVSAQRNGGAAHLQEIRNKIALFNGRLDKLVGKERISAAAASQLTAEVQHLSGTVTD